MWYWSIRPFWYWLLPILYTCIGKILYYEYFEVLISSVAKLCYFCKKLHFEKTWKNMVFPEKTLPLLGNFFKKLKEIKAKLCHLRQSYFNMS